MRNFSKAKRIVIKIGTNTLSKDGGLDTAYIRRIAGQVAGLTQSGREIILVTSGAIGMGAGQLNVAKRPQETQMRQACAAIGQPMLMHEYRKAFLKHNITIAQVLLTAEVLNNRKTYLNLQNSVETLLDLGVVPIVNENDSVSTEEIGSAFGDNDKLSALVASKIDADLLIILSDIDALYDKDPKQFPDAKPIDAVFEITSDIIKIAGAKGGSSHSVGGMKTKIQAAQIAANAGCRIVLANGRAANIISRIINGDVIGTVFMPKRKLSNRSRWILNSSAAGTIKIDEGAAKAIRNRKSLLPSGVIDVKGNFDAESVVMINGIAKAVTNFGSDQLRALAGKHSAKIKDILGPGHKDVVANPENIVFIDY
ncbi:MAG: glutamate 5-kinase [Phycisphaerae bacterium]|nr:glutamate 5-kinase [Phycisphaerae bacterium]